MRHLSFKSEGTKRKSKPQCQSVLVISGSLSPMLRFSLFHYTTYDNHYLFLCYKAQGIPENSESLAFISSLWVHLGCICPLRFITIWHDLAPQMPCFYISYRFYYSINQSPELKAAGSNPAGRTN